MVQSVFRMLDILEALAFANEELSLSRLQAQLNLPSPTLHRMLRVLIERGYVAQDFESRHYGPGVRILEIAEATKRNSRFDLSRIVRPYLQRLTALCGETSNFVIPQNRKIVYVEQVPSPRSVRMFTEVGQRAPLYCTAAGKAILSKTADEQFDAYVTTTTLKQVTPRTITTVETLRTEIASIRDQGFALDDEEFETGVRCVAAPIIDSGGRCVAAISVSGPATRMSRKLILERFS